MVCLDGCNAKNFQNYFLELSYDFVTKNMFHTSELFFCNTLQVRYHCIVVLLVWLLKIYYKRSYIRLKLELTIKVNRILYFWRVNILKGKK